MNVIKQQSTTNYKMFLVNQMNRLVADADGYKPRRDLLVSMKEHGYLKIAPITCYKNDDETLTIIDGHNRLAAAMALGLPVEYIAYQRNGQGEITPVDYSKDQKQWKISQCIQAHAHTGNEDYIEICDWAERNDISLPTAASLFSGQLVTSGNIKSSVREGTFKIKDRKTPSIMSRLLSAARPMYAGAKIPSGLVAAFNRSLYAEGFDPERMIEKINKYPELCQRHRTVDQYMIMLEEIYNRHSKGKKYLLVALADEAARERNLKFRKK
jgi:hypothetical protein